MSLQIGIVGLPNVGKSTLFNALTRSKGAQVANYPFCTIDKNVGVVEVPDERLAQIAAVVKPERVVPTVIEFVDIAGLVKGASKGEGLGNQFLAHIRECDAIIQVVRLFEDPLVSHPYANLDSKRDIEILESELILADLQTLEKRLEKGRKLTKSGDKEVLKQLVLLEKIKKHLEEGKLASQMTLSLEEKSSLRDLFLLTMKPLIYLANIHEDEVKTLDLNALRPKIGLSKEAQVIPISAKIEAELNELSEGEALEYLKELGLKETGLNALIHAAYQLLNLRTFFTTCPKEVRAWTVQEGTLAPQAAGVIHTDFEKGFIKAEVTSWRDFGEYGEQDCREKGLTRTEGKTYEVKDGDVIYFHFKT